MEWIESIGLSTNSLIGIGVVLVIAIALNRVIIWLINRSLMKADDKGDRTKIKFFKHAATVIIWILAVAGVVYMIPTLRALSVTMFAGAGIMVAVVGFAAQQAFANVVSGIFIVVSKPYRVGDLVRVQDTIFGVVDDITLRHTVIKNFQNQRVVIPNSVMGNEVIVNETIQDLELCRWIEVGISYDSDLDRAIEIVREVAEAHPDVIDNRSEIDRQDNAPKVEVRVFQFGESSVDLRALVWTRDPYRAMRMHSDINREIKHRFDAENIEIPFPHRTIAYKKDILEARGQ